MRPLHDRADAGRRLAAALGHHRSARPLVLGIPRGGVPVAAEVARALDGDLDVVVARKAGAPGDPELAIGAVTPDGARYVNDDLVGGLGITPSQVDAAFARAEKEARDREERFRGGLPGAAIRGRTVIVVDDGVATGATLRAALRSVRRSRPARLVAAAPVGAPGSCDGLRDEADEVVVLDQPAVFFGVSQFYEEFPQVTDEVVGEILRAAKEVTTR